MKITLKNALKSVDMSLQPAEKLKIGGMAACAWVYELPVYDGAYRVVPKAGKEQVLKTKEKTMIDDVTVEKVPFYEVSNLSGGTTCYIAEEV